MLGSVLTAVAGSLAAVFAAFLGGHAAALGVQGMALLYLMGGMTGMALFVLGLLHQKTP